LRVILRGVDLMVDRARFTLVKTSCRSRCWLNTYWKDNFLPHEFKVVDCLKDTLMYGNGSSVMCLGLYISKHINSKTSTACNSDAMKMKPSSCVIYYIWLLFYNERLEPLTGT
ncbi:hypothetical protein IWW34DRAFT_635210, partial [Fusarium oxysporum f. sp. albedinis]